VQLSEAPRHSTQQSQQASRGCGSHGRTIMRPKLMQGGDAYGSHDYIMLCSISCLLIKNLIPLISIAF